jgi:hypothetical protein
MINIVKLIAVGFSFYGYYLNTKNLKNSYIIWTIANFLQVIINIIWFDLPYLLMFIGYLLMTGYNLKKIWFM